MRFTISLKNGLPMGIIKGGQHDGEIIYLLDKDSKPKCDHKNCKHNNCAKCIKAGCMCASGGEKKIDTDDMELLIENFFKHMKGRVNFVKLDKLQRALINKERPTDRDLEVLYDEAMSLLDGSKGKEVILPDGAEIKPIFDTTKERQVFYVTGMSGSGKSTYVSKLVEIYHKLFPNNSIYLFSNKPEDPALDKFDYVKRIKLDDSLVDDPIQLPELKNSLVIFDDIEAIPNKQLANEMDRLRDMILQQGRSYKVSFCYVSHLANNYKQTRTILNECHAITIFPAMCTKYSLKYLMEKYFGFGKHDLSKLLSLPSRWVTIHKAPVFVLYEKGGYLLN